MVRGFESKFEELAAPRLRWRWLTAAALAACVTFAVMLSLVLPPYGNVTLKALIIMLFGLVAISSALFTIYSMIQGDDHPDEG